MDLAHHKLHYIDALFGAHVRVTVLINIHCLRCDLCARAGGKFHAAYEVLGVRVCRKHLAKFIDGASTTLQETNRRVSFDAVTTLTQVRKNDGRAVLKHDLMRALEKIGILEIPDPNLDLND